MVSSKSKSLCLSLHIFRSYRFVVKRRNKKGKRKRKIKQVNPLSPYTSIEERKKEINALDAHFPFYYLPTRGELVAGSIGYLKDGESGKGRLCIQHDNSE